MNARRSRSITPSLWTVLVWVVLLHNPATGYAQLLPIPLAERVLRADVIVEGRVVSEASFWNDAHTMIYTAHRIEVYKVFKGETPALPLELVTEGGTVGLERVEVYPGLKLKIGQVGLFLTEPSRAATAFSKQGASVAVQPYGGPLGFIRYQPAGGLASDPVARYSDVEADVYRVVQQQTGRPYVVVQAFDAPAYINAPTPGGRKTGVIPSISSFSPSSITAGTASVLTIDGTDFGGTTGTVFFRNADDGGSTFIGSDATAHIVSWTDTQITVEVPADAGTGTFFVRDSGSTDSGLSATDLTITYSINEVLSGGINYIPDHYDDDGSGGYTFTYNTSFAGNADAKARFEDALDTWRCGTLVNWEVSGSTTSDRCEDLSDTQNLVSFDDTGCLLASGVLGVAYTKFVGCSSGGEPLKWRVENIDLIFNEDATWYFGSSEAGIGGSESDFQTVALHEQGHGHVLGHVIDGSDVMNFTLTVGTTRRSLSTNTESGGDFIAGLSDDANAACEGSPMTLLSVGSCLLPVELVAFEALVDDADVLLAWRTASETNNAGFEIQHRPGVAPEHASTLPWEVTAFVDGHGTTLAPQQYAHRVEALLPGRHTFRLKQIDFDGTFEYSPQVEVLLELPEAFLLTPAYPNPFNPEAHFTLMVKRRQHVNVTVFDAWGRRVRVLYEGEMAAEQARALVLEAGDLPSGLYLVRAVGEMFVATQRALLVK